MSFTRTWGQPVRDAVETMALSPDRLTAKAIYEVLAVGGVDGITGPMVPPPATVARWVSDHRRLAREAIGETATDDTMGGILAKLRRTLRKRVGEAKTPAEIKACAAAAREIAGLERDLVRGGESKAPRAKKADAEPAAPDPMAAHDAFVKALARDDRRSLSPSAEGEDEHERGAKPNTETTSATDQRAAAS